MLLFLFGLLCQDFGFFYGRLADYFSLICWMYLNPAVYWSIAFVLSFVGLFLFVGFIFCFSLFLSYKWLPFIVLVRKDNSFAVQFVYLMLLNYDCMFGFYFCIFVFVLIGFNYMCYMVLSLCFEDFDRRLSISKFERLL